MRRAIIDSFRQAASVAEPGGTVVLMITHGTPQSVDLAPTPHWTITDQTLSRANERAENNRVRASRGDEIETGTDTPELALLELKSAVAGRFRELKLACCNVGQAGTSELMGRLQRFLEIDQAKGLDGFLASIAIRRGETYRDASSAVASDRHPLIGLSVVPSVSRSLRPEDCWCFSLPPQGWRSPRRRSPFH